jgi:hypothetical protein
MAKPSISIGVDDATGQPESAPEGPYITDQDDGSRPRKRRPARRGRDHRIDAAGADQRHGGAHSAGNLSSRRKAPAQP